MNILWF